MQEELGRAPALPAADVADHGRPRPAARHQQHLRPPRRRRGAARRRRGLPPAAARLRRAGPLRRRGVLDPPAGDTAGAGVRDRRPDPPRGRGARCSRSRPRASRSAPPSRWASPRSRATARTRTSSSTRPTSPSTARSSRDATASSTRPNEPLLAQPDNRAPRLVSLPRGATSRVVAARSQLPEIIARGRAPPDRAPARSRPGRGSSRCRRRLALLVGLVGVARHRRRHRSARSSARRPTSSGWSTIVGLVGARPGAVARGRGDRLDLRQRRRCARRAQRSSARVRRSRWRSPWPRSSGARAARVFHQLLFNVGALSLAIARRGARSSRCTSTGAVGTAIFVAAGLLAGLRLLRRQHGPALDRRRRSRAARTRSRVWRERFSWLAPHYARLRLHRRRHLRGLPADRRLGDRRLRAAALPDAQDAGGLPQAHRSARRTSCAPPPRRSSRRTSRSSRRTSCSRSARPRRWSRCRRRSTHATPTPPATRAACSSSRSRSARELGALARGARAARARGALPRHRQARHPGRDPAQAGEPDRRTSGR